MHTPDTGAVTYDPLREHLWCTLQTVAGMIREPPPEPVQLHGDRTLGARFEPCESQGRTSDPYWPVRLSFCDVDLETQRLGVGAEPHMGQNFEVKISNVLLWVWSGHGSLFKIPVIQLPLKFSEIILPRNSFFPLKQVFVIYNQNNIN